MGFFLAVAVAGTTSQAGGARLLTGVAFLVMEHSSRPRRLQSCRAVGSVIQGLALEPQPSVAVAHVLLVTPRPVGFSPDQGSNPCLRHWQVDFTTEIN